MNNELISRKALLAEYCEGCDALAKKMCDQDICGVAMMINDAPAVDAVEVVHGEWEKSKGLYSCSVCGKVCPYDAQADAIEYWSCNFCPNCGADMRERKGDDA